MNSVEENYHNYDGSDQSILHQRDDEGGSEDAGSEDSGKREKANRKSGKRSSRQSSSTKHDDSLISDNDDDAEHAPERDEQLEERNRLRSQRHSCQVIPTDLASSSDLENPPSNTKKRKSKRGKRRSLFNARNLCCCLCFISVIVVVAATVLLLQKRVTPSSASLPPSVPFEPPSNADCIAISKGNLVTPKDKVVSSLRRFQISMELELEIQQDAYSSALLSSTVKEAMQIHLMPMLADCPKNSRRLSMSHSDNTRNLEEESLLPQYIISNGIVVSVMLNPNAAGDPVGTTQPYRYLLVEIIDIWLQDEVENHLVIKKVRQGLNKFSQSKVIQSQVQITKSVVLSVEAISALDDITAFPTLMPTRASSDSPSEFPSQIISETPIKLPSLHPTKAPTGSPSVSPSDLPSGSPSFSPSSEPSQKPSTFPSSIPKTPPTSRPTREPTLSPSGPPTKASITVDRSVDVVIVGAGAAGLTAAYHLEQQGVSVVVLEAANRYGGRMKQDGTSWDVSLGLGPEWLHVDNPNEMLSRIVGRAVNKQTIAEPNLAHRWTGTTLAYNPPGRWSGDYRWMGGTWWDFFDQELASNLPANTIVLNSVVQKIDYEYYKPVVFLTNGRKYEGSYVIVTASVRTLQLGEINFVPRLPSSYMNAINGIEMDIAVKVFLEFTEKFYPDVFVLDRDFDNYSMDCESSRHGERLFYDPTVGRITNTNILGMFTYAGVADLYTGQEESAVIQTILSLLDEIFDGRASQTFVKGVVQDWAKEPHIRTAYTKYGSSRYRQQLREPIDSKLFFAGEAVRTPGGGWGYVHGAAYCGKDVAQDIIGRIRG